MRPFHHLRTAFSGAIRIVAAASLATGALFAPAVAAPIPLLADEDPPVFIFSWGNDGGGSAPGEFDDPEGIAVGADGKVYIADTDNHRIQVFEADGTPILQYGTEGSGSGQFQYPGDVAVDDAGNLYVADTENHRILILDVDGTSVTVTQQLGQSNSSVPGQFSYPSGIAVTPDGAVFYVADAYNHRIQVFTWDMDTSAYVHADTWGGVPYGAGPKEFSHPEGIAVAPDGSIYVADTSNDRIQQFDSSGAFIREWGERGTAEGQFYGPSGVTVDADGNVFVAEEGRSRIQKFTADGEPLMLFGTQGQGNYRFSFPRGVAVTSDETILVIDTGNHKVKAYRPASYYEEPPQYLASWGTYGNQDGGLAGPVSIAIDESGFVYVGNSGNHRVQKFTAGGGFLSTWGSYGEGADNVAGPNGIAVDTAGNVYVTDFLNNRLHRLAYDGSTFASVQRWGSGSERTFYYPAGVAVDSGGNVYVADQGHHQVQKYDIHSGEWTTFAGITGEWGDGDGQFNQPYGIAVDHRHDWVYVSDYINQRIKKFGPDGTLLAIWGSYGQGAGEFDNPFGIAVDAHGNVYVVDYANHRIQKFDSDGGYLTQWGSEGSGAGEFSYPYDVAAHPNGDIYVCDTGNDRIQVFGERTTVDVQLHLKAGWNMVSVPLELDPDSNGPFQVFENAVAVYTWNPGSKSYEVPDFIEPHCGYWVAVTGDRTITVTGTPKTTWPATLTFGWNMIGSVHGAAVAVNDLGVDPPGSILTNAIYWWNPDPDSKSYETASGIEQGRGYWAATTETCTLAMTAPPPF